VLVHGVRLPATALPKKYDDAAGPATPPGGPAGPSPIGWRCAGIPRIGRTGANTSPPSSSRLRTADRPQRRRASGPCACLSRTAGHIDPRQAARTKPGVCCVRSPHVQLLEAVKLGVLRQLPHLQKPVQPQTKGPPAGADQSRRPSNTERRTGRLSGKHRCKPRMIRQHMGRTSPHRSRWLHPCKLLSSARRTS